MVALYVILSILVLFNFNLYHHLSVGWGKRINESVAEEMNENAEIAIVSVPQELHESSSDHNW